MKKYKYISLIVFSCCVAALANAANVFYSFDTATDGTGAFTAAPSAIEGFTSASAVTKTFTVEASANVGGATFTDFQGTTWIGSGASSTPGHSLTWNGGSTGNSFSLTLDTTNLSDLTVRMDIRSAGTTPPNTFSSFTYAIDGGTPVGIAASLSFSGAAGSYHEWTADLSSIGAIENQNSVTLTWNLPNVGSGASVRIDNLQISAIPEPATAALVIGSLAVGCAYTARRRHKKMRD